MLGKVAPQVSAPLVTMVSYAIIYRHGAEKYADELVQRGVAGMIVPDLPVDESPALGEDLREPRFESRAIGHATHSARNGRCGSPRPPAVSSIMCP